MNLSTSPRNEPGWLFPWCPFLWAVAALALVLGVAPATAEPRVWTVYQDVGSEDNHGEWTNYMPEEAGQMLTLSLADTTGPAAGSTCIRVHVRFQPPDWCGVAVASAPNYWGERPGPAFDLRGAKALTFMARGSKGDEVIQVKCAIAGDKPHGDSAKLPAATKWMKLTRDWQRYELPLDIPLNRVITPFCFVTSAVQNKSREITFFLDEIRFLYE